jgi:hypothetical protein
MLQTAGRTDQAPARDIALMAAALTGRLDDLIRQLGREEVAVQVHQRHGLTLDWIEEQARMGATLAAEMRALTTPSVSA